MEDYHVDRPGVEVRQRMQLTGTNSSIDLITPIYNIHRTKFDDQGNRAVRQYVASLPLTIAQTER